MTAEFVRATEEGTQGDDDIEALSEVSDGHASEGAEALEDLAKLLLETRQTEIVVPKEAPAVSTTQPTVEAFVRNFLVSSGLSRTFDCFQSEWYEQSLLSALPSPQALPDVYIEAQQLRATIVGLEGELEKLRNAAEKAKRLFDKFKRERDFHRTQHKTAVGERDRLLGELRRVRAHYEQYEPALSELKHRYDVVMKEKFLLKLDRDRIAAKLAVAEGETEPIDRTKVPSPRAVESKPARKLTPWPAERRERTSSKDEPFVGTQLREQKQFSPHDGAGISRISVNPRGGSIATAGDDHTWRMFSLPLLDSLITCEGHKGFVSAAVFHPVQSLVVTSSGDSTIKLWDLPKEKCKATMAAHSAAVWGVNFHDSGDFVVSASMDQTARVIDLPAGKVRHAIRGHVDSVNWAVFQPLSNLIATASADKTCSLWDMRTARCAQSFYGHRNALTHCAFGQDILVSCDLDGAVKVWDLKKAIESHRIDTGTPAHSVAIDRGVIAIAGGDGHVRLFDLAKNDFRSPLEGHSDAVNDVCWLNGGLLSAGADGLVKLWQ